MIYCLVGSVPRFYQTPEADGVVQNSSTLFSNMFVCFFHCLRIDCIRTVFIAYIDYITIMPVIHHFLGYQLSVQHKFGQSEYLKFGQSENKRLRNTCKLIMHVIILI